MSAEKKLYVKDIVDNQQVNDLFMVKEMRQGETKAGKPFLSLELMDKSGDVAAKVWDNAQQVAPLCEPGNLVVVTANSQSYKGTLQLRVVRVEKVDHDLVDLTQFLPASSYDVEEMAVELVSFIDGVSDKFIKKLLRSIIDDQKIWGAFKRAPAAKQMHHAYIGGLLEHTLGICRLAAMTTKIYPSVNYSLLLAGAVLHDIGKVREFSFEVPPFNYSDQGRLIGHMVISIEIIQDKISVITDFPEKTAMMLKHLILSHHGRHEFGSPALPMTREAFVLNFLDDLDAKMNYLDRLSLQAEDGEYQWTDYQRNMERFLFVTGGRPAVGMEGDHAEGGMPEAQGDSEAKNRQPSLWE